MKLLSSDIDQKKFGGETPYRLFIPLCSNLFVSLKDIIVIDLLIFCYVGWLKHHVWA